MLKQPVVVVNPFLSKDCPLVVAAFYGLLFSLSLSVLPLLTSAESAVDKVSIGKTSIDNSAPSGYLARILNNSPEEVTDALKRAEELYFNGGLQTDLRPIALVLHGPEVEIFFKDQYKKYKETVDLAARLSAFGVIDLRVCETQTGIMGRQRSSLHPFIGTVIFGPSEVKRLLEQQNYVYF